ncbi:MAG: GNAT family N-acetyltransferase [Thermodesulfobacteriota bacterium]
MYDYSILPVECIQTDEGFRALREEWNNLLVDSWSNNIFLTWEWMYTWWKNFKGDSSLMIFTIRDRMGKLVCVAPFRRKVVKYYDVMPVARIQFIGTRENEEERIGSKYLDVILLQKRRMIQDELLECLFRHVIKNEIWDEIILENLRSDSVTLEFMGNVEHSMIRELTTEETGWSRYLKLPDSWDKFVDSQVPIYKYRINRTLETMKRLGEMRFEVVETEEELEIIFNEFVELHKPGNAWRANPDLGLFSNARFYNFHHTVLKPLFRAGTITMARLTIDGKPCGVIYNMRHNKVAMFYELGMEKKFAKGNPWIRPGLAMHIFAIKKAIEWGCTEYDFLTDRKMAIYTTCWFLDVRRIFGVMVIRKRNFKLYTDSIVPW